MTGVDQRRKAGAALCGAVFLLGIAWRCVHVLVLHPPTSYVYSDMAWYVHDAVEYFRPGYAGGIEDTLHSPGNRYFLGALYLLDPGWRLAVLAQLLLCCLAPPLIGAIGYELYGRPAALVAATIASLYFPFIDYAGYFLSENQFLFCLLLAAWLLLRALRAASAAGGALLASASGLAWGAAVAVKEAGLAGAAAVVAGLLLWGLRGSWPRAKACAACLLGGLSLVLWPLAARCTRLSGGSFCLVSNLGGVGFLSGHCGEAGWIFFKNTYGGDLKFRGWKTPSSEQRGYARTLELPFNSYDSRKSVEYGLRWTREHPLESLRLSSLHVWDLFFAAPFPSGFLPRWSGMTRFFQCAFWVLVLLPACARARGRIGKILRLEWDSLGEALLLLPLGALVAVVFMTSGEFRYRLPYDGFLIVLAAAEYAGSLGPPAGPQGTMRRAPR